VEDETLREANALIVDKSKVLDLSEIGIFRGFSKEAIETLSSVAVEESYKPGELIFHGGEISDEIYFIRKGTVKIVLPLSGGMFLHLATFTRGGFFGDMAFLDKGVRSANAVADDDVLLSVLSRSKFNEIGPQYPAVVAKVFERLAFEISHRLRQSNIEVKALQEN